MIFMHFPEIVQLVQDDARVMLIALICHAERHTSRAHYENNDTKRKYVNSLRLVREMH